MRKRIAILICAALLILAGLAVLVMASGSLSVSTGRILVADNGTVLLISHNSPIVLGNRGRAWVTEGLSTGDEVLVIHDGIAESYPAQTGAYFVYRKGGGTMADLPPQVLDSLRELGWIQ